MRERATRRENMDRLKTIARRALGFPQEPTLDQVDDGVQKLQTLARNALDTYQQEKHLYFEEPKDPRRMPLAHLLVVATVVCLGGWDSWIFSILFWLFLLKIYFDVTRIAADKAWGILICFYNVFLDYRLCHISAEVSEGMSF